MKSSPFLPALLILAGLLLAQAPAQQTDPTRLATPIADVLRAQLTEFRGIQLLALVANQTDDGIAILAAKEQTPMIARPGSRLALQASGVPLRVLVKGISEHGVALEAPALEETFLLPASYTRSTRFGRATNAAAGRLNYVEFNRLPLGTALRLLADQCEENYVPTEAASKTRVSLFLRNVTPEEVLNELCRTHGLWATRNTNTALPTTRILTMEEFVRNLANDQQSEQSKTFTLLYPNVTEVASIIQSIYADRVYLSLGSEDVLDDEMDDLSRRFERFSMLTGNGSSSLLGDFNLNNNWGGSRSYGRRNNRYGIGRNNVWYLPSAVNPLQAAQDLAERASAREAAQADSPTPGSITAASLMDLRQDMPVVYVTISRRNNMLVVRTADSRVMDDVTALVKQLDVPTPMVLLEVKVLELSLTDDLNTVFEFSGNDDFKLNSRQFNMEGSFAASDLLTRGLTFQILSDQFTSRIQLLQEKGKVNLIATPTLMTANNEVSQLFIGKEVPIVRNMSSETIVTENNVVTTSETDVTFERVGTLLLITPNINADRTVTFRLLQENSAIAAEKSQFPVLASNSLYYVAVDVVESRSISGTFVAQDQRTIAVGGLIREEESEVKSGIPILMDIPVLGWFFRSTERVKSRTELVILITPHVVFTPSESSAVSEDYIRQNSQHPAALTTFQPAAPRRPNATEAMRP